MRRTYELAFHRPTPESFLLVAECTEGWRDGKYITDSRLLAYYTSLSGPSMPQGEDGFDAGKKPWTSPATLAYPARIEKELFITE